MALNSIDPGYEKKRGYSITIYDLQGGPIPEKAIRLLEAEVEKIAKKYKELAINASYE